MSLFRLAMILFSLCFHAGVAGVVFVFSGHGGLASDETVYTVSLAEFAAPPSDATAAPVPPPAAEPEPQPEPEPRAPELEPVKPEPPKKPEVKKISAKKKTEPPQQKAAAKPPVQPPSPPQAATSTGAQGMQMGGLIAYKTEHVDQRPSISRNVLPEYPAKARRMNVEGSVVIQLVVDCNGHPQSCIIKKAQPPDYFEEAALAAVHKMRFVPGKIKGKTVNTLVLLPIAFKLR